MAEGVLLLVAEGTEDFHLLQQQTRARPGLGCALAAEGDAGGFQVTVRQVVHQVADLGLVLAGADEAAGLVFHGLEVRALDRHLGPGRGEQGADALHRPLQGIQHPPRAYLGGHLEADGHAGQFVGTAEVVHLGLGRHRVGDHHRAALAGEQVGGAPVDFHHLAFGAVDGDPVIQLIGLGGVQDDAGEHVAEGALQRQADDDGHDPGRGQQALYRQLHHIGRRGDHRHQEDHRAQQVLQQPAGMADAWHQQAEHHRERARAQQPPDDFQHGGCQVEGAVRPGRRLQRVHAGVDDQAAEQQEQHHAAQHPPGM
ncbi:hypothetical protein D9M68_442740 [compost metagenome]